MEERSLIRHVAQPVRVRVRTASYDRFWSGFDARIYDTTSGYAHVPPVAKHGLTMLVGPSALTSCRCGGRVSRRFQVPGDIDVVPAGWAASWEDSRPATFMDVNLSQSLVQNTAYAMGLPPERVSVEPQLTLADPQLSYLFWAIKAELELNEPVGRLYADSLGVAMTAQLLRRYAPVAPRRPTSLSKRRLARVVEYIHDHLAEDLSLLELSDIAGMSPSHFKVLFKESVGLPVHQFVIRRRVEYATGLIACGHLPLSEIALQAGFANQSHMARWMKRVIGTTPRLIGST